MPASLRHEIKPVAESEQTAVADDAPPVARNRPVIASDPLTVVSEQSAAVVIEKPAVVTDKPADVIEPPTDVIEAPAEVIEAPAEVIEAPAEVIEAPAVVNDQPAVLTDQPPAEGKQPAVESVGNPAPPRPETKEAACGEVPRSVMVARDCYPKSGEWAVGVKGLFFQRDSEDDVAMSGNLAGDTLLSTNASIGTMGGVQVNLAKRNHDGNGLELIYWGLYPGESSASISGPDMTTIFQPGEILFNNGIGIVDVESFFFDADTNYVTRTNVINNIEANLMRSNGEFVTRGGRKGSYEFLGGFRWFQFNENFVFGATNAATVPTIIEYDIDTRNTLLGFQLGGRSEYFLSDRLTARVSGKLGVFNNRINQQQEIRDGFGILAYRTAGGVDDFSADIAKDDLSLMGEMDLGISCQVTSKINVTTGYRVMGVSGIALAPNQIPRDFAIDSPFNEINSNGDLILGGGYAGLEFNY